MNEMTALRNLPTDAEKLKAIRAIWLRDPSKHTKGTWARNMRGLSVNSVSARAVCWCAHGAMIASCVTAKGRARVNSMGCTARANDLPNGYVLAIAALERTIHALTGEWP